MLTTDLFKSKRNKQFVSKFKQIIKEIEEREGTSELAKEVELLAVDIDRWMFTIDQHMEMHAVEQKLKEHESKFYKGLLFNAAKYYEEIINNDKIIDQTSFLFILRDDVFQELVSRIGKDVLTTTYLVLAGFIFIPKGIRENPNFSKEKFFECFIDIPSELAFAEESAVTTEEKEMLGENATVC